MRKHLDLILIALALVAASAALYTLHYALFGDAHHILIYFLGELAFLPVEVLLVALVIERLLARRERAQLMRKMNMVIGTFFSELGMQLLGDLTPAVENGGELVRDLAIRGDWAPHDYKKALRRLADFDLRVRADALDLAALKATLAARRDLVVMLLANPNLLEHEHFTDLLWAVSHLAEELQARPSLENLPASDREHLAGDAKRVYAGLAAEWLRYCRHLQVSYPYIFSIMVRTHPLQEHPLATVT
jgi:hypothetical protein